jgi:hypothetical protein
MLPAPCVEPGEWVCAVRVLAQARLEPSAVTIIPSRIGFLMMSFLLARATGLDHVVDRNNGPVSPEVPRRRGA